MIHPKGFAGNNDTSRSVACALRSSNTSELRKKLKASSSSKFCSLLSFHLIHSPFDSLSLSLLWLGPRAVLVTCASPCCPIRHIEGWAWLYDGTSMFEARQTGNTRSFSLLCAFPCVGLRLGRSGNHGRRRRLWLRLAHGTVLPASGEQQTAAFSGSSLDVFFLEARGGAAGVGRMSQEPRPVIITCSCSWG